MDNVQLDLGGFDFFERFDDRFHGALRVGLDDDLEGFHRALIKRGEEIFQRHRRTPFRLILGENLLQTLLGKLDIDGYFLEWDNDRSGGFEPLRFLPKGKVVVLGLVTTKFGEMESKDSLKRRIEEAAKYAPLEQLALSPQCGFSSTVHGNNIAVEAQRNKLPLDIAILTTPKKQTRVSVGVGFR